MAEKMRLSNHVVHSAITTLLPGPCAVYSMTMLAGSYHNKQVRRYSFPKHSNVQ